MSANFHDFWPLPPYHSSKMLMKGIFDPYVLWPFDHRHMKTPLPPKTCWRLRWMVPYMPGKNKWIILMKVGECSCYWILLPLKSRSNLFFQKLGTLQLNKCIAHFKKRGWTSNFFMIFDNHISNGRDLSEILLNSILSKGGKHLHRLYFFSSLPPCWASRVFGVEINYWGCSDWHNPL